MFNIPTVDFYITNVCNLTCRGCNRFNNLGLKGFQRWDDHAVQYEQWSKRLTIDRITIIGGEPTLNPDLEKWCYNLRRLWPTSEIMIQSNGTYYRPEFKTFWQKYNVGIAISLHDKATVKQIQNSWKGYAFYLKGFVFQQNALVEHENFWTVHESNPKVAFDACGMKNDATMFNGKLHKCPTVATLPVVFEQKDVRLSKRQLDTMLQYKPLLPDCSDQELLDFVDSRDSHIPNCEFCPSIPKWHTALGKQEKGPLVPDFSEYKNSDI